ncbi:1,4-alpha-glucan branching enzyme GlgB [Madurella mycetomatis]|uniref:1,4-alpha-glucan branching enzyme GlgB n=1 Tax=Madurella mycetomatis TaxID=100816 RepID=A0A175VWM6_9PEZI|nr:1,4-alpha-glucan branching enzyme GlgB [Madurella mycetomatis]
MYPVDILNQRHERFVLWVPGSSPSPPVLIIGVKNGDSFDQISRTPLVLSEESVGLWALDPASISPSLQDGVYHYWFEVQDTLPEKRGTIPVTDPFAFTVDYSVATASSDSGRYQPASVIKYRDGKLWPCDVEGVEPRPPTNPDQAALPRNNQIVIYELPTSWAKAGNDPRGVDVDVGTFTDVLALFNTSVAGDRFASVSAVRHGAILTELGINALELLPVADAKPRKEWGYAPAHYFATDCDLGSSLDLTRLVDKIHSQGVRFFVDVVMAFGHDPYTYIDFNSFHLRPHLEQDNPDSYQSHAYGVLRDNYGGNSWRYISAVQSYDPESGAGNTTVRPSWVFHRAHLARWMADFGVDGLRLDSVNNIANYDFVWSYKERAWELYNARYGPSADPSKFLVIGEERAWELYNARYGPSADPSKFLVIGEELSMPVSMVRHGVINALWNAPWQSRARAAILGRSVSGDNFEWNVRKLVDCTQDNLDGTRFSDGAQAINYITSHDIEGDAKERLYNFLVTNGVWDVAKRAKLAFALLLTSVGIPMIFAGEEFADQMDRSIDMGKKQTDPVNYERKNDGGWRQALFGYVANLVKFRTKCPALGENDTDFFHVDRSHGRKIMAWRRGRTGDGRRPVIVVANFSDEGTPGSEYVVPNWPGRHESGWREISQGRDVPPEWVGREPLFPWEAKVYTRWVEAV